MCSYRDSDSTIKIVDPVRSVEKCNKLRSRCIRGKGEPSISSANIYCVQDFIVGNELFGLRGLSTLSIKNNTLE